MTECGRRTAAVAVLILLISAAIDAAPSRRAQRRHTVQVGLASFYGPGFDGDRTASGVAFDQRQLVSAHRTLPLGSLVKVTNLENGRSVVVRVIDRGPFGRNHRKGCIIDVSRAAARRLQFLRRGLAHVRLQVLKFGDPNPAVVDNEYNR
jgi:rare lipoprotein A